MRGARWFALAGLIGMAMALPAQTLVPEPELQEGFRDAVQAVRGQLAEKYGYCGRKTTGGVSGVASRCRLQPAPTTSAAASAIPPQSCRLLRTARVIPARRGLRKEFSRGVRSGSC